ncbi:MAG TPA: hypothetical protein VMR44_03055, partial [Thermoanaerobaculia bacterium]|nr:hypothetical protein [Thermoanaerobaculia bacterium]
MTSRESAHPIEHPVRRIPKTHSASADAAAEVELVKRAERLPRAPWLAGCLALGLYLAIPGGALAAAPVPLGRAASAPPEIVFEAQSVVASGFLPAAEVIFHGVSRERHVYLWRLVQRRDVVAADAEGVARLDLPDGVAPLSLWTVVGPESGEFRIASPEGFTPTELPFPGNGLDRAQNGAWRVLRNRFERAEVLYVRPGVGAWYLVGVRGSDSDRGRSEGRPELTLELDQGEPFWRSEEPPEEFAEGDV